MRQSEIMHFRVIEILNFSLIKIGVRHINTLRELYDRSSANETHASLLASGICTIEHLYKPSGKAGD